MATHGQCLEQSDVGRIKMDLKKVKSGPGKNDIANADIVKEVTEIDYGQVGLKDQGQFLIRRRG